MKISYFVAENGRESHLFDTESDCSPVLHQSVYVKDYRQGAGRKQDKYFVSRIDRSISIVGPYKIDDITKATSVEDRLNDVITWAKENGMKLKDLGPEPGQFTCVSERLEVSLVKIKEIDHG